VDAPLKEIGKDAYDQTCVDWNTAMLGKLTGPDRPDFIVLSSAGYSTPEGSPEKGFERSWAELQKAGVPFTVLHDTPRMGIPVPECVTKNIKNLSQCSVARSSALPNGGRAQVDAAKELGGVSVLDLSDWICTSTECPSVVGNVLVYRDSGHLSATYAATLAKPLGDMFDTLGIKQIHS
jgi:hypothetical protein